MRPTVRNILTRLSNYDGKEQSPEIEQLIEDAQEVLKKMPVNGKPLAPLFQIGPFVVLRVP